MGRYEGKSALVIGGTRGIGLATAALLDAEGAHVIATGSSRDSVSEAKSPLGSAVDVTQCDITQRDEVEHLVAGLAAPIDLLVISAAINAVVPFTDVDEDLYDAVFSVNARAPFFVAQQCISALADGAAIVLVTSVANVRGMVGSSVYAATKAATRSFVRSLAAELSPRGIRVNAVSPGPTDTGILERSMSVDAAAAARESMSARNPMGRFGEPDEVARAIVFMGFDATFTTGAELPVDGGVSQL